MSDHSPIPPSSAGIFGPENGCTGWPLMAMAYPEPIGEHAQEAAEGEASHELAAVLINRLSRRFSCQTLAAVMAFSGEISPNGVAYTDEMFEAALIYAQMCVEQMVDSAVFGGDFLGVEAKVHAPQIHEESWGTCDFWLYDEKTGTLYIFDYKYGMGLVEVFENWQLMNYAAAVLHYLASKGILDKNVQVCFRIAQPRGFHKEGIIREWTTEAVNLRAYINILSHNAHVAMSGEGVVRSGKHCRYCTARHACPAALEGGVGLYEAVAQPMPQDMTPPQIGLQLSLVQRAIKQLGYLETAYKAQLNAGIRQGQNVIGWRLDPTEGNEIWNVPHKDVIETFNLIGHDVQKDVAAITPNQAREKGVPADIVEQFSERPKTGLALVPDNDNKAKKVFS